jgi:protein-disulfide isomerase
MLTAVLLFRSAVGDGSSSASTPIGLIGSEPVTQEAFEKADQSDFQRLHDDYETEQHRLQFRYAKARYDLLKQRLDARLDEAALEAEAKARGAPDAAVLADLKVTPPTDEEVRAFYEKNRDRVREPFDQVASQAREYLMHQRDETAKRVFYDQLRAKHGVKSLLGPYRVDVAATGPARGPDSAPVTIVEFGDFQCPYCRQAESSLRAVLAQYPGEVRVVFRNLPLSQIHPQAGLAAEAAVCADHQGKFWQMHDAMYADQSALTLDALKDTAKRLGLNVAQFSTCLAGGVPASLDDDLKAAQTLGLTGTPYFFINGRPLDGNVPLDKFQSVIADELRARAAERS